MSIATIEGEVLDYCLEQCLLDAMITLRVHTSNSALFTDNVTK